MSVPTVQVLLDDGTGTYPYDITTYVRMPDTIGWTHGRADETSDVQPGTMTLVLDNKDGRFSFGNGTYNVAPDQGIKVLANGGHRWTGRVQAWPVSWPTGDDQIAFVQVTATDDLARLARRTLFSATQEEITADLAGTASAFYPLDDDPGMSLLPQAHDALGNGPPLISQVNTGATLAQFAQPLGTPDGATGVKVVAQSLASGLPVDGLFIVPTAGKWRQTFASLHVEMTYNLAAQLGTFEVLNLIQINEPNTNLVGTTTTVIGVQISLQTNKLTIQRGASDTSYDLTIGGYTGLHTVSLDTDATSSRVHFDGVLIDSRSGFSNTYDMSYGFQIAPTFVCATSNSVVVGNVAFGEKLSSARAIAHQNVILTDLTGETPAARITRLAGYAGASLGAIDTAGSTTLGYAAQTGRSVFECMVETAKAGQGIVFANDHNQIKYVDGYSIAADGTPDATLDANWVSPDAQVQVDMQKVINYTVGKSVNSNAQFVVQDTTSIAAHGVYRTDMEWNVDSDDQALNRTNWTVKNYAAVAPRFPTLTLDLLTMTGSNLTNALTLDVGKYLRITGLPSQNPGGSTQVDLTVQGVSEVISDSEWSLTLNCAPHSVVSAGVLDDTTWGVLGTTSKLYL